MEPQRQRLDYDSATLPVESRFATWCSAFPYYDLATPDPLRFAARGHTWLVPPIVASEVRIAPLIYRRSNEHIRSDQKDDITMQLLLAGQGAGNADGVAFAMATGDVGLQDMARPVEIAAGEVHMISLAVPRTFLDDALPAADVHGLVLRRGHAKLLRAFLAALPETLDEGAVEDRDEIARLLRDLLAAALRQRGRSEAFEARAELALRSRARRYIARHLTRPLDVATICSALGASRSKLYRAFERDGGIVGYVQRRRLARLHRLFSDPAERRSISELATLHGFLDMSHFSTLFRRTYGVGPRALREGAARQKAQVPEGKAPQVFQSWRDTDD